MALDPNWLWAKPSCWAKIFSIQSRVSDCSPDESQITARTAFLARVLGAPKTGVWWLDPTIRWSLWNHLHGKRWYSVTHQASYWVRNQPNQVVFFQQSRMLWR
jgi:hypothetical protein